MNKEKLKIVSIFSGAGGLDLGFERTGHFKSTLCIDYEPDCIETLKINQKFGREAGIHHYLAETEIRYADLSNPKELFGRQSEDKWDVLIGGPPCQSFSVAGKRGGTSDARGGLVKSYMDCVELIQPRAFVLENVPGIATVEGGSVLSFILDRANEFGYSIWHGKLCAADYGDSTLRVRYFIIAARNVKFEIGPPKITHGATVTNAKNGRVNDGALLPYVTVEDALTGLSNANNGILKLNAHTMVNHKAEVIERFSNLKPGERDEARRRNRLNPSKPALTLFSGGKKGKKQARSHIHPYYPRELTPRECARLHSFPDYWLLAGDHDSTLTQISNSVPVMLAEAVARALLLSLGVCDE